MNDDFSYAVQESFCEFAITIQFFLNKGWRIVGIKHGERKFGLYDVIIAERGEEKRNFSPDEIEHWVRRENQ